MTIPAAPTLAADVDLWPTLWAPLILLVAAATLGLLGYVGRRLIKRLDDQDESLAALKLEQTKQFGGNSGGIREAVDRIEKRVDSHLEFHAKQT